MRTVRRGGTAAGAGDDFFRAAAFFGAAFFAAAGFVPAPRFFFALPRELVAAPAERAAAAGAVEVRVFRFFEGELERAPAATLGFERVAPADDAEGVFGFVRPEPAADRASFRDMILAHGRVLR
jgi:hypothetical protein